MTFGSGKFTYELVENWGKLPSTWTAWTWGWIVGLACDSQDRIFVYSRSERPLLVFDRAGNFLESWGDGILTPKSAHGIYVDAADNVYL